MRVGCTLVRMRHLETKIFSNIPKDSSPGNEGSQILQRNKKTKLCNDSGRKWRQGLGLTDEGLVASKGGAS